jgi:alkanesulfonate monooxygenase SsuD/methylene tetrahydromethanopterin reductase-like flavin-dependent oxidoreductase (luciferase family)
MEEERHRKPSSARAARDGSARGPIQPSSGPSSSCGITEGVDDAFWPRPVQSQPHFDAMLQQGMLAESLGFNMLWVHEHHSAGAMYPAPLMALAALAGRTQRVGLGTDRLLLPLYHSLRVAEEGAMVDTLSGGLLRLGVSAGYSPADLRAFDVPANERGRRMREGLQLIRAVWTGDHDALGDRFAHLRGYTIFPKPVQQPAPPIYVGATVDAAVRRAARLGDEFIISTTQRIGDLPRMLGVYHEELRTLGRDPALKVTVLNRIVHVVPDRAAKQEAIEFFGRGFLQLYDTWGHQNVTELDNSARSPAQVGREHFIIGEAALSVGKLTLGGTERPPAPRKSL